MVGDNLPGVILMSFSEILFGGQITPFQSPIKPQFSSDNLK